MALCVQDTTLLAKKKTIEYKSLAHFGTRLFNVLVKDIGEYKKHLDSFLKN